MRDADSLLNGSGSPQRLHDLDRDGADEIVVSIPGSAEIQVKYGSRERWSGEHALEPELTVSLEGIQLLGSIAIDSGDTDMDGAPELLLGTGMSTATSDDRLPTPRGVVFALRGTGERVTGVHTTTDSDIFFLSPEVEPSDQSDSEMLFPSALLSSAGDVDGDGGRDALSVAPSVVGSDAVFLLPSGLHPSRQLQTSGRRPKRPSTRTSNG